MKKTGIKGQRLFLIGLFTFTLVMFTSAKAEIDFDRLVVFGTSLSDPGNLFALMGGVNVPPAYDFDDDLLVPNSAYAIGGHHLSNGDTWIEQLAKRLRMNRSVLPAFRNANPHAMNYAIAGTRAGDTGPDPALTFAAQVEAFCGDSCVSAPTNALYVIEIGGNDVRDAVATYLFVLQTTGNPGDAQFAAAEVLTNALTAIATQVGLLVDAGANKFFYVNVPLVGVIPSIKALDAFLAATTPLNAGDVINLANALASEFNTGLAGIFSDPNDRKLDLFTLTGEIVADPDYYGLMNVDDACVTPFIAPYKCQTPDDYLFWDGVHPTKAGHTIFASEAGGVLYDE